MKIAILYSGHLRSIEQTHHLHLKFINLLKKEHELKIFCQTWDEQESKTESWWGKKELMNNFTFNPEEIINKFIKPDEIIINEKLLNIEVPLNYNSTISYEGIYSMFYGINQSYILYKKFSEEKDWVADILIKIRYDIDFNIEPVLNNINNISQNKFLVFSSNSYDFFNSYSDTLFVFDNNTIDLFNSFELFKENKTLTSYFNKFKYFIPEVFISEFVLKNKNHIKLNKDLFIIRVNGNKILVNCESEKLKLEIGISLIYKLYANIFVNDNEYKQQLKKYLTNKKLNEFYNLFINDVHYSDILNTLLTIIKNKNKRDIVFQIIDIIIYNNKIQFIKKTLLKSIWRTQKFL